MGVFRHVNIMHPKTQKKRAAGRRAVKKVKWLCRTEKDDQINLLPEDEYKPDTSSEYIGIEYF